MPTGREQAKKDANPGHVSDAVDISRLAEQVLQGHRRALARALTLVESEHPQHQALSLKLFSELGNAHLTAPRAFRLGITGPPGAGKSTVIERLVLAWLQDEAGHRSKVAVLAIDPSSRKTGGSLLGDKTRMGQIAHHARVFVRPSPNSQTLGGLGRRTPLMCSLLERAGFDKIVVETVGVGQSEIVVRFLVDRLLLVALPGSGDEVQGIKRGLMEEVDVVAVKVPRAPGGSGPSLPPSPRRRSLLFRAARPGLASPAPERQLRLDHLESSSRTGRARLPDRAAGARSLAGLARLPRLTGPLGGAFAREPVPLPQCRSRTERSPLSPVSPDPQTTKEARRASGLFCCSESSRRRSRERREWCPRDTGSWTVPADQHR